MVGEKRSPESFETQIQRKSKVEIFKMLLDSIKKTNKIASKSVRRRAQNPVRNQVFSKSS